MPAATTAHPKRGTLSPRVKLEERNLIDRVAKVLGKSPTSSVLDAARAAAEEALLDRVSTKADANTYAAVLALLGMPPQSNEHLRKTMQSPPPWDKATLSVPEPLGPQHDEEPFQSGVEIVDT